MTNQNSNSLRKFTSELISDLESTEGECQKVAKVLEALKREHLKLIEMVDWCAGEVEAAGAKARYRKIIG